MKKVKLKKRRNKLRFKRKLVLTSTLVLLLVLGIGYSLLSVDLHIFGNIKVKKYYEPTLYNVLKREVDSNGLAKEYTGQHQDSMDPTKSTEKIYHWYAESDEEGTEIQNKNNVIFADICWQMIRTTDTGGVKLLYNGEAENGKCLNTRGKHVGYNLSRYNNYTNLSPTYYYGDNYTYDKTTNTFSLTGNVTTGEVLLHRYTCRKTTSDGTCTTLYYVESLRDDSYYNYLSLNGSSHYSTYGDVIYNDSGSSLSRVGYMYGEDVVVSNKYLKKTETLLRLFNISNSIWYADSAHWNSSTSKYELDNPYNLPSNYDYNNLIGKYSFFSTSNSYSYRELYYIVAVSGTKAYCLRVSNAKLSSDYSITYGDSFVDNGNNTYTINNANTVDYGYWFNNYSSFYYKYVCLDAVNNTCSNIYNINEVSNISFTGFTSDYLYKYAKSFTYDGTNYILDNTNYVNLFNMADPSSAELLNNNHYTCFNTSGVCSQLYYIGFFDHINFKYEPVYITLYDGDDVDFYLYEAFNNPFVNQKDSVIKKAVDLWFDRYLSSYDNYIDDVIYCNDRSIKTLGGYNPNGGDIKESLRFNNYLNSEYINESLYCNNITDRFSTSNNLAKLEFNVGLITTPEMLLFNNTNAILSGEGFYFLSPSYIYQNSIAISTLSSWGSFNEFYTYEANGLRPAIALKSDTKYSYGNGSMENPYYVHAIPSV